MLTRRDPKADVADRPFNNLLRRLNAADYGLIEPYLAADETRPGDLLYNPGDDCASRGSGAQRLPRVVP